MKTLLRDGLQALGGTVLVMVILFISGIHVPWAVRFILCILGGAASMIFFAIIRIKPGD